VIYITVDVATQKREGHYRIYGRRNIGVILQDEIYYILLGRETETGSN
jgi:hypothetical protein